MLRRQLTTTAWSTKESGSAAGGGWNHDGPFTSPLETRLQSLNPIQSCRLPPVCGLRSLDGLDNEQRNFAACTGPVARECRIGGVGPLPPLVLFFAEDFAGAHLVLDRAILQLDKSIRNEAVIP